MNPIETFRYYVPKNKYIGILSIPHSGEIMPPEFKDLLTSDLNAIHSDVDYKVDELVDIDLLVNSGIAVIVSNIHRVCVDLNRPQASAVLNWKKNSKGENLVMKEPSEEERTLMEAKYHVPYFEMIKTMIKELHKMTDKPISFIDLHSMPSKATDYHLKITPDQPVNRPDFCVSDIEGKSCSKDFIDSITDKLKVFKSNTTQNMPYYGGHITRHIHAEYTRINNIQIEINRKLYMNESEHSLDAKLAQEMKTNLTKILIDFYRERFNQ